MLEWTSQGVIHSSRILRVPGSDSSACGSLRSSTSRLDSCRLYNTTMGFKIKPRINSFSVSTSNLPEEMSAFSLAISRKQDSFDKSMNIEFGQV